MSNNHLMGSESLSRFAIIPLFTEHSSIYAKSLSKSGAFIGAMEKSGIPFFLDPGNAINPHVFITGLSGSGKTYLTKNLMLKLHSVLGHSVVLFDFTGEYLEFAEYANCTKYIFNDMRSVLPNNKSTLLYVGLSGINVNTRISAAMKTIAQLSEIMRTRKTDSEKMLFIVLDEAWKLLLEDKSLSILVREGRKYGVGIILASQLIEDMELSILSNIATLFVFRMQNRSSLKRLELNYQLNQSDMLKIQNLGIGQCLVIQLNKSKTRSAMFISKVKGLDIGSIIRIKNGVNVVEIEYKKLENIVTSISKSDPAVLLSKLGSDKEIELHTLIAWLMRLGAERIAILSRMRKVGLADDDIADSFAIAIEEVKNDE